MSYVETSLKKTISGVLLLNSSLSVTLTWSCTWATGLKAAKGPALCGCTLSGLEAVALHTLTIGGNSISILFTCLIYLNAFIPHFHCLLFLFSVMISD